MFFQVFFSFFTDHDYGFNLGALFMFITGTKTMPPLGLLEKISITFVHSCEQACQCRPTTSTCAMEVRLPVHIQTKEQMQELTCSAIKDCKGYGVI